MVSNFDYMHYTLLELRRRKVTEKNQIGFQSDDVNLVVEITDTNFV